MELLDNAENRPTDNFIRAALIKGVTLRISTWKYGPSNLKYYRWCITSFDRSRYVPNPMKHLTLNRPIQHSKNRPVALVSDPNIKKTTHRA